VQIDPSIISYRLDLAILLRKLKRYDEAKQALQASLQIVPNEAILHNYLGLITLQND